MVGDIGFVMKLASKFLKVDLLNGIVGKGRSDLRGVRTACDSDVDGEKVGRVWGGGGLRTPGARSRPTSAGRS